MTAQPTGPAPGPDTGSHEVIHLGGHAAVVVPLTWCRSGISPEGKPAADLPLTPAPGHQCSSAMSGQNFPAITGTPASPR